ncbi:hypothetical protein [Mycobacterium leprae]|uniref:hypothetical protein n=1 Tax=Mycobacterium leprae TaxID=1769 RepID=UPI00000B01DF|nr:hypothetical protein [Mycobacterium leprae]AAA63047.1 u650ae [Mycobacterium leprae]
MSGLQILTCRLDVALSKVDGLVSDLMKSSGIPGMAMVIVNSGKELYANLFGAKGISIG